MRFPHNSEYVWIIIPLVCLFVFAFNAYRLGKFQKKKAVLPWAAGGFLLAAILTFFLLSGCTQEQTAPDVVDTITTELAVYNEMSDGTWQMDGQSYQYRLTISGRMPNAVADSTFVYLSNLENITFDQAWKAAGFSSNTADYFSPEEAVLVDWKTD